MVFFQSLNGGAIPTNKKLYQQVKDEIYAKNPKHSAYRSMAIVKEYKKRNGKYEDDNKPKNTKKWLGQKWTDVNHYYHTGEIIPCGSQNTINLYNEYPLCRPKAILEQLSKPQLKMMIDNKTSKKPLITEKILGTDKYNIKNTRSGGIKAPFGRIGGKSKLKKKIVEYYFPKNYKDLIYVEPFIGAGSIYFYKDPSKLEIINDLDTQIYTLLKGFKKFDGAKISKDINGLYNKELFDKIKTSKPISEYGKFIRTLQLTRTSFFQNMNSYGVRDYIQSNFNDNVIKDRMKDTIILNEDYKKIIKEYDSPETFFYLDPPYDVSDKSYYAHSNVPIKDVYNALKNIKGKFLLSYNDSIEAKNLFKNYYINYVDTTYTHTNHLPDRIKKEMLISNYDPFN